MPGLAQTCAASSSGLAVCCRVSCRSEEGAIDERTMSAVGAGGRENWREGLHTMHWRSSRG